MLIVGVITENKVIISKTPFNIENPCNEIDENIWKIGNSFLIPKPKNLQQSLLFLKEFSSYTILSIMGTIKTTMTIMTKITLTTMSPIPYM